MLILDSEYAEQAIRFIYKDVFLFTREKIISVSKNSPNCSHCTPSTGNTLIEKFIQISNKLF